MQGSRPVTGVDGEYRFHDEDADALIARIRELRPKFRELAPGNEANRWLLPETLELVDSLDIWNMPVPRRWGGRGMSATAFTKVQMEVAKGDPSVAWVLQIVNGTTWVTTLGPDESQEGLYAGRERTSRIAGSYNPPGVAREVDGGYLVSGKWPYASGIRHADFGQWGVILEKADGTKVPGCFCYIPTDRTTIEDTWYVTGLQATGSDSGVAKDVFVPAHMMVTPQNGYSVRPPGKKYCNAPSDNWAQISFVSRTGVGQVVGMAEALLELVIETSAKKPIVTTTYTRAADSAVVQREIGLAAMMIQSARMMVLNATEELDRATLAKVTLTEIERANNKAQGNYAIDVLSQAVDKLMYVAGSSAFSLTNPISRYFRDFHVAARHIANIPNIGYEVYGKVLLGISPNILPPVFI